MLMKYSNFSTSRRSFCSLAGGALLPFVFSTACRRRGGSANPGDGRLKARPLASRTALSGKLRLGLDSERDAILQLPKSAGSAALPLLLFLHGAGQSAEQMFEYLGSAPEEAGVAILAPNSRERTWDAIADSFGPDVEFLNRALERVFAGVNVDAARVAVGGFSDGASYAVSLGLINGDLFSRVVAFSPGFVMEGSPQGRPRFFISHGIRDHILPIDRCGRRIGGDLRARGYDVNFREFDGDHEVPDEIAREGLRWVAEKK
jgi:phospholipase/carboxylesterase